MIKNLYKPFRHYTAKDATKAPAENVMDEKEAKEFVEGIVAKAIKKEMDGITGKLDTLIAKDDDIKKKLGDPGIKSEDVMDIVKEYDSWVTKANSIAISRLPRELSDDHIKMMGSNEMGGYFAKACYNKDEKIAKRLTLLSPQKEGAMYEREKAFYNYNEITKDLTGLNTGAFLMPPQFRQTLIDLLRKPADIYPRCTIIPVTGYGPIIMPAKTGGLSAYWTKETALKVESDIMLTPLEWDIATETIFTEASQQVVNFSEPALGAILTYEFARAATAHFNRSFYYALGYAAQGAIRGIDMDITDVYFAGAFTWQDLLGLEYTLQSMWKQYGGYQPWYHMNEPTEQLCRLLIDIDGRPIWFRNDTYSNFQQGVPGMLNGYPYYTAPLTEIPANKAQTGTGTGNFAHMFFGDWVNYWIFELQGATMRYSDSHADNFQHNIRAFVWERYMAGRMLPRSFAKMEGVPTP